MLTVMDQSGDRTLIAVDVVDEALRPQQLKTKPICRLCLAQDAPLSSIFASQGVSNKTPPVSLQIMACCSIEVYAEDGMPGKICDRCVVLLDYCYQFKQICKDADTQLKLFLTTGIWPEKLTVPKELKDLSPDAKRPQQNLSARGNVKSEAFYVTSKAEGEQSKEKKVNLFKLSPADMKNLNARNWGSNVPAENSPVVWKRAQNKVGLSPPVQTSTPMPVRDSAVNRQGSRLQLHEKSKRVPMQKLQVSQQKDTNSPVILNKLAGSLFRHNVKEEFVATGNGTIEMVMVETVDETKSDNIFPCTECPRTFKLKQLLDIHRLNHIRARNFPCGECDKRFFSKYDLAKHMATHTGERPYVCVICRAAFSRSTLLTRHQALHKADLTHACMFCNRVFVSKEELDKHTQTHEKPRPFLCNLCPKSFAYKQGLERHAVVHGDELPHKCAYCNMSFHTSAMLSRHLTAHAGSRPYPCRLCNKSFLLSHHLSRHLRSHNTTDQSEYRCNDCKRSFPTKNELIFHSAKHAKEDLVCPMCREVFDGDEEVDAHIQLHVTINKFACDYCDLMYTSEPKLAAHCQEVHVDELACEWSEEQQRQLNAEQEQSLVTDNVGEAQNVMITSNNNTRILVACEEGQPEFVQCDTIRSDDSNVFMDEDDQETAVFTDQYGEDQVVETFEVTEFVEAPANDDATPPEPIAKEKESPSEKIIKREETQPAHVVARQKSAEEFYQRNKLAVEKRTAQRKVSDMLKRLPKGMTITREPSSSALTTVPSSKTTQVVENVQSESSSDKGKAANQAPPKDVPSTEVVVKRKPGRPPKIVQGKEGQPRKMEQVAIKKPKQEDDKGQEKPTRSDSDRKKVTPEKKSIVEGGLKRSGTMNFPKNRVGIDGPTKTLQSAAKPVPSTSGKGPMQMVRRSYVTPARGSVVVGTKRAAEKEPAEEEVVPSKRPVPSSNRNTLNPKMLSAMSGAKTKTEPVPGSSGSGSKARETGQVNVVRTIKRVPNADAIVGAPVEMNVGGKTIKMQKLILTKDEALALHKSGKMKGKV